MAIQQTKTENLLYLDRITLNYALNRGHQLRLYVDNEEYVLHTEDNQTWTPVRRPELCRTSRTHAVIQMRSGHLFWAKNRWAANNFIDLKALFDEYWSSSKPEYMITEVIVFEKYSRSLELRFTPNINAESLPSLLRELESLLKEYSPLINGPTETAAEKSIEVGAVFEELSPITRAVFGVARVTSELLKEQLKYGRTPSGFLDRLQRILSFANKIANVIICEEIKLLEGIMPRALRVMLAVAETSRDYVRNGQPEHQGTMKDMNKALTTIIKYFRHARDVEALHFTDETGASLLFACPTKSMGAPIGRLPVELWQNILLLAIGSNGYPAFTTTCTASTFIHFLEQEKDPHSSYLEHVGCRATLRQVCRAWNEFLKSTDSWWVHAEDPYHPQKSFDLPPVVDQVAIVKRLSMTITTRECVGPALNWASDLFQRVQAPILSYNINLEVPYDPNFTDKPYDLLAPVSTKMALRSLRITCRFQNNCKPISLSQINANFKDLVSLSLSSVPVRSTEELTLPRLEFLYIHSALPTEGWDLPRLRHVYLAGICCTTKFHVLTASVRRYASQLESLVMGRHSTANAFPADFWAAFPALRLFGLPESMLRQRSWGGWAVPPPRSHPLRYLVCGSAHTLPSTVSMLSQHWTYHDAVALVVEETFFGFGVYYLIEDLKQRQWEMGKRETNGILPIHPPASTWAGRVLTESIDVGRIFESEKWKTNRVREREESRRQAFNSRSPYY